MALFLAGCAGFRDTKIGKIYNDITAKYNGYFNARELVKATALSVEEAHQEDFTQILDVYRLGNTATGKSNASDMDKAIEKCSEVIQDHEGSEWIDDSYFVIAKAYFYKAEYYTAVDLFKYLANEYEGTEIGDQSKLWIVKCYIQLEKNDDALAYLTNAENDRTLDKKTYGTELNLLGAHIKIAENNYQDAIGNLVKAITGVKDRQERFRLTFILAQLYEETDNEFMARKTYESILNKNMPYEFLFQTRIRLARNARLATRAQVEKTVKTFKKLLRDDNNIEYFDQIHYEIGNIYLKGGNKEKAIEHYKTAAFLGEKNMIQKANTYLALGDLFFSENQFVKAGAYYDSCAAIVPQDHPNYEDITKQQVVLSDLITNLDNIKTQDSLQLLASLDDDALDKAVNNAIEQAAEAAKREKEREERQKRRKQLKEQNQGSSIDNGAPGIGLNSNNSGDWYFYNPVAVGKGITDFKRKWGNRPLEDHWRRSDKQTIFGGIDTSTTEVLPDSGEVENNIDSTAIKLTERLENIDEDKLQYYANIPFLPAQKNASDNLIIEALFENGQIYYEQLNDINKGKASFDELLKRYPENKFLAATHFYLFKINNKLGDSTQANVHKAKILNDFPTSEYAALVNGNNSGGSNLNVDLESLYQKAVSAQRKNKCDSVEAYYAKANEDFDDNYLRANFSFLKTVCNGKSLSKDSFVTNLQSFIRTFPGTEIALEAKNIIRYLLKKKEKESNNQAEKDSLKTIRDSLVNDGKEPSKSAKDFPFNLEEDDEYYFIIVAKSKEVDDTKVKSELSNYNIEYHRRDALTVRSFVFSDKETLFLVKGFDKQERVSRYYQGIKTDENFAKRTDVQSKQMSYISTLNFKVLIDEQNSEEYFEFFDLFLTSKEN